MGKKRTFGWVQNPGYLTSLKRVVGIFLPQSKANKDLLENKLPLLLKFGLISPADFNKFCLELKHSPIEIDYATLKGKGCGGKARSAAICTGIVQATLEGQKTENYTSANGETIEIKKPYTDDWSADGYLRWANCCGLLEYVSSSDTCKLTALGKELAKTEDGSEEEFAVFSKALLSYPPVIRILTLLQENGEQTKFELGQQLGFKGELGFTSFPLGVYLCDYHDAKTPAEKEKVKSNEEGDADKYARGIANWCIKMGWAYSKRKQVSAPYKGTMFSGNAAVYGITRKGEKALIKANGNSSNPRIPKVVMFEMLASNKAFGADYLRYLRGSILKALSVSEKSVEQLKEALKGEDIIAASEDIVDQINGLKSIGLRIIANGKNYRLLDTITALNFPSRAKCVKDDVIVIKDRIRAKLSRLDHKYLVLVDLAYSDAASKAKKNDDARAFEFQTADLFSNELGFWGKRLGDSNKPDVLISYNDKGTIIDNKSYKDGFSIDKKCADEMGRYINENVRRDASLNGTEWWTIFPNEVTDFTFLFVTSFLKGQFEKQLEYISKANGGIQGAAIGVENLLYFSEAVKRRLLNPSEFYQHFQNQEMSFEEILQS